MRRLLWLFLVLPLIAPAQPAATGTAATESAVTKPLGEVERLRQGLDLLLPDVTIDSIQPSPIPGLYEVTVGPQVVYMTPDARFMIEGDITDIELRKNLTQPRVRQLRLQTLDRLGEKNMLVFQAKEPKYVVTVFTDIDCGYCRKMQGQIGDYNQRGITIRYLLFPRAGVGSASWTKAVSAWCAEDRHAAFTIANQGKKIPERTLCVNPVNNHLALGTALGVTSTPALVLPDGSMLPGYVPPDKLEQLLQRLSNLDKPPIPSLRFRHQQ